MKKQITVLLAFMTLALVLGGCGSTKTGRALEAQYREEGIALMDEGRYEEAVVKFDEALSQSFGRVNALDIDICYYKAVAAYKSGSTDQAIEIFTDLINYDPNNNMAYYMLGTIYAEQGDLDNAKTCYEKAVALNDTDYEMIQQIYLNLESADAQLAGSYLEASLTQEATTTEAQRYQGYFKYLLGDSDGGVALLQQAADAGDIDALFYLTNIALDQKDYDTALSYVERGLMAEDTSHKQEFEFARIAVYEYKGDFASARTYCEQYVTDYPDDEAAAREYTFLQTR